jgi:tight adherence protein C
MATIAIIVAIALALAIPGCVLVLRGARNVDQREHVRRRLAAATGQQRYRPALGGGEQRSRLDWLGRLLTSGATDRREIGAHLRVAGWYNDDAILWFAILRLGGAIVVFLVAVLVLGSAQESGGMTPLDWGYAAGAAGLVYVGAKRILMRFGDGRLRRIRREMPFVLDILLVTLESGLSLDQSLRHFAQTEGSAGAQTRRSLQVLVDDLEKGAPYEIALNKWGDRLGIEEGRELAVLFRQSILHGSEVGPLLREFVRDMSEKRLTTARESIGAKTTKLTAIMVAFFLPALMIVVGAQPAVSMFKIVNESARTSVK